jgi:hypothetical protein
VNAAFFHECAQPPEGSDRLPNAKDGRRCAETTKRGQPCPADVRRRPDPDGLFRCPQHTRDPVIQERVKLSRQVATMIRFREGPLVVSTDRYETRADLDALVDHVLNTLRAELYRRKDGKASIANAIFAGVEAKLKLAQLEVIARMLARMKGRQLTEAAG